MGKNRAAVQPPEIPEGKAVLTLSVVRFLGVHAQIPLAVFRVPVLVDERVFLGCVRGMFAPVLSRIPGDPCVLDQLPGMPQCRSVGLSWGPPSVVFPSGRAVCLAKAVGGDVSLAE